MICWSQFVMSKIFVASLAQSGGTARGDGKGGGFPASSIFYIVLLMQTAKDQIHVNKINK